MKNAIRILTFMIALSALAVTSRAEDATVPHQQDVVVHVVQDAPKVADPTTAVQKADEWVEFGKHLGGAFDAGLTSLSDHAEKFSKTDAGRFTMAVIAWKVAGKDAMNMTHGVLKFAFGIATSIVWTGIFIWFLRKFCRAYSVKESVTGSFWSASRKVTYKVINEIEADAKIGCITVGVFIYFFGGIIIVANLIA
jgi:hypothetical protein